MEEKLITSTELKAEAVWYQTQNSSQLAQGTVMPGTSILHSATCAQGWNSQRNLQPTMTETAATFPLQLLSKMLYYNRSKTADIPVLSAEAAMTTKIREKDEWIHSTSKPCAAIMANGLPSTLLPRRFSCCVREGLLPLNYLTVTRFVPHFRNVGFSVGKMRVQFCKRS